jgi:hypothetical protein
MPGKFEIESDTRLLNPLIEVTVISEGPDVPATKLRELGDDETEKSGGGADTALKAAKTSIRPWP